MAVLPDKILEDYEIEAFVNRVNSSAEKIVSDPRFKISSPSLPGVGLLLKLQIRAFEKSLASSFAPIFIGKNALNEGIDGLSDAFDSIKTIFTNPLQFLLDEGVNSVLEEFPFPIRLEIGGGFDGSALGRFSNLISDNTNTPTGESSSFENFNYDLVFGTSGTPKIGEILTQASSIEQISRIVVNTTSNNSEENELLLFLRPGDKIQLSDNSFIGGFTVNSTSVDSPGSISLSLTLNSISEIESPGGNVSIPGFKKGALKTERNLLLRSFVDEDGRLKIPLSVLGISIPFVSQLSLVLGDFSKLKDSSPTKIFVDNLSERSGLNFSEILSGIIEGNFPKIDFAQLQKDIADGNDISQEKSKEDLVSLARLIEIGSTDPFFLIKILLNYVKLLLLPISVVVSVIKGLGELITGPVSLIKTVIKAITNPLGLICELISSGFLDVLRPLIEKPIVASGLSWKDALNDPESPDKGLKPLLSDMVCGKFRRDLSKYIPDQSFFQNLVNSLPNDKRSAFEIGPTIPYDLLFDLEIPKEGQVSINNSDPKQVTLFRISTFSNTVENSTSLLSTLNVGDQFSFSFLDSSSSYRVNSKQIIADQGSLPYFQLGVQYVETLQQKSIEDLQKDGIKFSDLKSKLTINNPDKAFLFIVEKYLSLDLLLVWESIKGIIGVFGGLAQQVPSLLPAVIRSLFGLNLDKSKEQLLALLESEKEDQEALAIDSAIEIIDLIYDGSSSLNFLGTDNESRSGSNYSVEARDALIGIIQNTKTTNEDGIENIFYDLAASLTAAGKYPVIVKDKLSVTPGASTKNNIFLNYKQGDDFKFAVNAPSKQDFFYGEYSLIDVGNSVKVLSSILLTSLNVYYFSNSNINLENFNVTVYVKPSDGSSKVQLYSGTLYNALVKYKFTKQGFDTTITYEDLRIIINREMEFLVKYGLPSLR